MEYALSIIILIGIYAILAISLNLMVGYTGIFSVHHAALLSIGAYVYAILSKNQNNNEIVISLLLAFIIAATVSALIGVPTLKVRGDYFIVASYGLQVIIHDLSYNLEGVTGGGSGIFGISAPSIFGFEISSSISYLILVWTLVGVTVLIVSRLVKSPFGRLLRAVSQNEMVVSSAGKDPLKSKIWVFFFAGGLASFAGVAYAGFMRVVRPEMFTIDTSILILTMIILGGTGSLIGSIVGAAVMILLPELIVFLNVPDIILGPLQQLIYGLLIIGFVMLRPTGLLGKRERPIKRSRKLKKAA